MPRSEPSIPVALGTSFTVATALENGIAPSQLRNASLEAPFHGIRMLPRTDDEHDAGLRASTRRLADAYSHRLRDTEFFSHETAAVLHDAPLPFHLTPEVHVTILRPGRASKARGIRSHSALRTSVAITL